MDGNKENQGHHENFQVDFDVLGHVCSLHCLVQAAQSQQLQQTERVEQVSECALGISCKRSERDTRDEIDEEGALEIALAYLVRLSNLDTLLRVEISRAELDHDIDEEDEIDNTVNESDGFAQKRGVPLVLVEDLEGDE